MQKLRTGVTIRLKGGKDHVTAPCDARLIEDEPTWLFDARYKASIFKTYSWLKLSLTEGKYRQVRKMVSAVQLPCLRLIRMAIEDLTLDGLEAGSVKEME